MKKILAIASAFVLILALTACQKSELSVDTDETGVHVVATGNASGEATGNISNNEDEGIVINHTVEQGSFHVKLTGASGKVYFDEDVTDNIANFVDMYGDFDVLISANNAVGTIDIIPYDKAAQQMADETMPSEVKEALGASDAATDEVQMSDEEQKQAISQAEADGRIVISGECRVYSGDELAELQDVDVQSVTGGDGKTAQYAVVAFSAPVTLNVASSGDMGNLREGEASMVAVAVSEPERDYAEGDLSFWEAYEGKTVTVSLDPDDTWWPSDVRLPISEPHTGTAELLFAE